MFSFAGNGNSQTGSPYTTTPKKIEDFHTCIKIIDVEQMKLKSMQEAKDKK